MLIRKLSYIFSGTNNYMEFNFFNLILKIKAEIINTYHIRNN